MELYDRVPQYQPQPDKFVEYARYHRGRASKRLIIDEREIKLDKSSAEKNTVLNTILNTRGQVALSRGEAVK